MTYKRQELRAGNFICLTTIDRKIIDLIAYYLIGRQKKEATLTELYDYIDKKRGKPTSTTQVKYCILILFIRHKVSINNWKKNWQTQFRTIIKWTDRKQS